MRARMSREGIWVFFRAWWEGTTLERGGSEASCPARWTGHEAMGYDRETTE